MKNGDKSSPRNSIWSHGKKERNHLFPAVITILKKPKVLQGLGFGLLIGGSLGILVGLGESAEKKYWEKLPGPGIALLGVAGGLLIGGILGAVEGADETIKVEGMSYSRTRRVLAKLRKKARIPDYE